MSTDAELRIEAQSYLDRVTRRMQARSLSVEMRVVMHEHPAVAILAVHSHDIDLLTFTTRGLRALPWPFPGSAVDKFLCGVSTSALVQRPFDHSMPTGA